MVQDPHGHVGRHIGQWPFNQYKDIVDSMVEQRVVLVYPLEGTRDAMTLYNNGFTKLVGSGPVQPVRWLSPMLAQCSQDLRIFGSLRGSLGIHSLMNHCVNNLRCIRFPDIEAHRSFASGMHSSVSSSKFYLCGRFLEIQESAIFGVFRISKWVGTNFRWPVSACTKGTEPCFPIFSYGDFVCQRGHGPMPPK